MADEGRGKRRRRGRRRGRGDAGDRPESSNEEDLTQGDVSADDVADEPEDSPDIPAEEPEEKRDSGKRTRRERTRAGSGAGAAGSPMDFWRSGRRRSARERRAGTGPREPQGLFKRITSLYLPPWVPVVGIIVLVFGVLGILFIARSATGAPRIGEDHWHATYTYYVCGEKQPPAPTWEGTGVHTHADGIIHIHPFQQSEEGAGARLTRWFDYGGGKLDGDEIRMPGSSTTYKNGDQCPDGTTGEVQVFVNGAKLNDYGRYIPQDGDIVRMVFGPPEEQVQLDDRIFIPEESATREIQITVDQPTEAEASTVFTPSTITIDAGEVVKIIVNNVDEVSHGLRIRGIDRVYGTQDDFVAVPEGSDPKDPGAGSIIEPGTSGFVVVRFDLAGEYEFHDPTVTSTTGTIAVQESAPSETTAPAEEFDSETDVMMLDDAFEPAALTIDAGERVRLNLTNDGQFVHNVRIAGPDGEFETEDDILSEDILPGESGSLIVEIEAGSYAFRDDFRPDTITGTLTVQ